MAQAWSNTTRAVLGRPEGTMVYCASSQKKSIFHPSTLWVVFIWLEIKYVCFVFLFSLGIALYGYLSLLCIPIFYSIVLCRAGPKWHALGRAASLGPYGHLYLLWPKSGSIHSCYTEKLRKFFFFFFAIFFRDFFFIFIFIFSESFEFELKLFKIGVESF
jgi:hypothetical protein